MRKPSLSLSSRLFLDETQQPGEDGLSVKTRADTSGLASNTDLLQNYDCQVFKNVIQSSKSLMIRKDLPFNDSHVRMHRRKPMRAKIFAKVM